MFSDWCKSYIAKVLNHVKNGRNMLISGDQTSSRVICFETAIRPMWDFSAGASFFACLGSQH
jgi:hypothetical protein